MDSRTPASQTEKPISERPFFFIVTAALIFIYVVSVFQAPALQQPVRLVAFTVLMLLYGGLFWLPIFKTLNQSQVILYLLVQTVLAFALSVMVGNAALVFGLVAPLIGIGIGMIPNRLGAALAVIGWLALSALAVGLSQGWEALGPWPLFAIPTTIFIIIYVVLYGRQDEARRQAQELATELEIANAELATYATQVEELTLAAERQRMARELHDTLAQGVAGLILQLEAVNVHLENGNTERAQAIVQQAMGRARSTLAEVRQAIDDLRQSEEINLTFAVQERAERFSTATGIPCQLELAIPELLPSAVQEQTLRALSEALTNVTHHAQATEVGISIIVEQQNLLVEVRDNGVGFDSSPPVPAGHYGLLGIRERARLAGGSAEIDSVPGAGTTIRLRLLLDEPPETST